MRSGTRLTVWAHARADRLRGQRSALFAELLGWQIHKDEPGWATIAPSDGVAYLGFQTSSGFTRPQWPSAAGAPRITMHLDFEVDDLADAVDHAVSLGARFAGHQPQDNVRVRLVIPSASLHLRRRRRILTPIATVLSSI